MEVKPRVRRSASDINQADVHRRLTAYRHLHMLTYPALTLKIVAVTGHPIDDATVARFFRRRRARELTCALFERFLQMEANNAPQPDAEDKAPQQEAM